MTWLHDVSQSALAAAVLALGLVILLELRSFSRLRQAVDKNLARVFEQLDLLRFENQQLIEAHTQTQTTLRDVPVRAHSVAPVTAASIARASAPTPISAEPAGTVTGAGISAGSAYQSAAALAASGVPAQEIADRCGLATGEARLLSSLAQARARRHA